MRFIKFGIIILLVLWLVTAPIAMSARAGSFLYRVQVIVNEPVWTWLVITGKARAQALEEQLLRRYVELEGAWVSNNATEEVWTTKAERNTFRRVLVQVNRLVEDQNFMVANTLISQTYAIVRAHEQVLSALVETARVSKQPTDVNFMRERYEQVEATFNFVDQAFAARQAKVDFVKGIDQKLLELKNSIQTLEDEIGWAYDDLTDEQKWSYTSALERAIALETFAINKLGMDSYVDSFKAANEALGLVLETRIILEASQKFQTEILASPVEAVIR